MEKNRKILIVDDELILLNIMKQVLQSKYLVTTANSAIDALKEIEQAQPPFDLIFCDLNMPDLDGIELFKQIAERWPGLEKSMIFTTGGATSEKGRAFLNSTSNSCVSKPFMPADLRAAAEKALGLQPK